MSILKDRASDLHLEKNGFVIVPFLDDKQLESLIQFYNLYHPVNLNGLYSSICTDDVLFRKKMLDFLKSAIENPIKDLFTGFIPVGGTYIVKYPGLDGILLPHQDSTIVNEDIYSSYNVWVPLVDTNFTNGSMGVVRHSHKFVKTYRGFNIPSAFSNIVDTTSKLIEYIEIKAGDALIYHHSLLHASTPNLSNMARPAIVYAVIPEDAQMWACAMDNGHLMIYECDSNFFYDNNPANGLGGLKLLKQEPYIPADINQQEFEQMIKTIS